MEPTRSRRLVSDGTRQGAAHSEGLGRTATMAGDDHESAERRVEPRIPSHSGYWPRVRLLGSEGTFCTGAIFLGDRRPLHGWLVSFYRGEGVPLSTRSLYLLGH